MQFDFIGMQATYLALAREDAGPIVTALEERPAIGQTCQWATFLRNHDELTLDKLGDAERKEVFAAFGPEPEMQLYDRGLKRRLPTMLGGDPRRIRMAYSLMFSLPGTPTLYYGEEIGMGEDLEADGRMAVRTPDAVERRSQRRLLHGGSVAPGAAGRAGRLRARARQRRLPRCTTRTHCGASCASSSASGAPVPSWDGARGASSTSRPRRCWCSGASSTAARS